MIKLVLTDPGMKSKTIEGAAWSRTSLNLALMEEAAKRNYTRADIWLNDQLLLTLWRPVGTGIWQNVEPSEECR